jgi:hypothetical protein
MEIATFPFASEREEESRDETDETLLVMDGSMNTPLCSTAEMEPRAVGNCWLFADWKLSKICTSLYSRVIIVDAAAVGGKAWGVVAVKGAAVPDVTAEVRTG